MTLWRALLRDNRGGPQAAALCAAGFAGMALLLVGCTAGAVAPATPTPGTVAATGCAAGTPDTSLCATLVAHGVVVDCIPHAATPCPARRPRTPVPSPTRYSSPIPLGTIVDCNPGFVWDGQACVSVTGGSATPDDVHGCRSGFVWDGRQCAVTGDSGVEGQVVVGPTCPVERADSPCPDRPAQVYVWTTMPPSTTLGGPIGITSTQTDADGRFRLALPPGAYEIDAGTCAPSMKCIEPSPYPRIEALTVTVQAGTFTEATLRGDTGIR